MHLIKTWSQSIYEMTVELKNRTGGHSEQSELEDRNEYDAGDEENIIHMKRVKNKLRKLNVFMVIWHLCSKTQPFKMRRKQTQLRLISLWMFACVTVFLSVIFISFVF